jgi:hypothetical protein
MIGFENHSVHSIRQIIVPDVDRTAWLAAVRADEWANTNSEVGMMKDELTRLLAVCADEWTSEGKRT